MKLILHRSIKKSNNELFRDQRLLNIQHIYVLSHCFPYLFSELNHVEI